MTVPLDELDDPLEFELDDELDEGEESSSSDADIPWLDVADTTVFVFVACASRHAIAPPSASMVATLVVATARLVRRALGVFFWSLIAGSGSGSRSGLTVRNPGKTGVSARVKDSQEGPAVAV